MLLLSQTTLGIEHNKNIKIFIKPFHCLSHRYTKHFVLIACSSIICK